MKLDILTKNLSPLCTWAATFIMVAVMFVCVPSPVQAAELTVGVFAHDFSFSALISAYNSGTTTEFLAQFLIERIADNPGLSIILMTLSAGMPLLGLLANRTSNPIDNAMLILLNKILQTLTANSSRNQPDVLSWKVMLTNRPTSWPDLMAVKTASDIVAIQDRAFY